jgi:hypothetical protein
MGVIFWQMSKRQIERRSAMESKVSDSRSQNAYPSNKEELLNRIHMEWTQLMQTIQHINEDEMTIGIHGGWSIKDHLAHITAWEQYLCEHHIRKIPPHEVFGMVSETYQNADVDDINDFLFRKNRELTVNQIRTELHRVHEMVLSELEQLPFSELMKPRYDDDRERKPLLWWVIANTSDHYNEHRVSIQRLVRDIEN